MPRRVDRKNERAARAAEKAARAREREAAKAAALERERAVRETLAAGKRDAKRPSDAVRRIFGGFATSGDLARPNLRAIADAAAGARGEPSVLAAMERLLLVVEARADLLRAEPVVQRGALPGNRFVDAVCAMAWHHGAWMRDPDAWKPQTHNARRQLASLARHLFSKWPVPPFMDSAWLEGHDEGARRKQRWFLHLGSGKSIRDADLPVTLTRTMAHQFLQAPPDVTVDEAIRWAQVRAVGGSPRLFRALAGTHLRADFAHDEFWMTVIQFLASNDLLDPARVGPIVDYVRFRKFEGDPPPEPGFTMKGRSVAALLERVEEWHEELAWTRRRGAASWRRSGFREWTFEEIRDDERRVWSTHELLTADDLQDEGRAMRHCVATYDRSCATGQVSIWSLRRRDRTGHWRILTVAVDNAQRRIVEARGRFNEPAPPDAMRVLERWAGYASLSLGQYL